MVALKAEVIQEFIGEINSYRVHNQVTFENMLIIIDMMIEYFNENFRPEVYANFACNHRLLKAMETYVEGTFFSLNHIAKVLCEEIDTMKFLDEEKLIDVFRRFV